MYSKLEVYVPESHVGIVREAIARAGAGRLGNYSDCIWETGGIGRFRPLDGSSPFIGEANRLEEVVEFKLETICPTERMPEIIRALRAAHPYETPAFQYWDVSIS